MKKTHVVPDEAVFIDDKQSALEPAKNMGAVTILFETPEQLRQKLIELKVF